MVALAAACLLLAACGSSSPSPSTGSSAGSQASATRYLAGANAVCARLLAKLDRLTQPTTAEQAVSYLPQALRIMQAENRQLATLDPPAGERPQLEAGLRSSQQLAALLRRFLHELQSGLVELNAFARVQSRSQALRADVDSHLRAAGLSSCTQ